MCYIAVEHAIFSWPVSQKYKNIIDYESVIYTKRSWIIHRFKKALKAITCAIQKKICINTIQKTTTIEGKENYYT